MAQHPFTDVHGYHHIPVASTVGILYNNHSNGPAFFGWIDFLMAGFHPPRNEAVEDDDAADEAAGSIFRVVGASRGLVAFRRTDVSLYSIGNPFVPSNAYRVLEPEEFHDFSETHVVFAVDDLSKPQDPVFRLICACRLAAEYGDYRFDVYSSRRAAWRSFKVYVDGKIVRNTGVSCGRARFAFFLVENPLGSDVFRFDATRQTRSRWARVPISDGVLQSCRLQLSRAGDQVYVVAINEARSRVEVYSIGGIVAGRGDDEPDYFFAFSVQEEEVGNNGVGLPRIQDDQRLLCSESPWPVRAESFKMEVLLWVDGRVVLWEQNTAQPEMSRALLLPLQQPEAGVVGANFHIADGGIAHVNTALIPGIFHPGEEEEKEKLGDWDE